VTDPNVSPFVSILIPCHNARQWIGQCVQSAIDQTYPHKEIVIVDDGSTDGSQDVIRSFGDRLRSEFTPNRGSNFARNRLVELSRGNWLSFLDADDYLLPEKIERQIEAVARNTDLAAVISPPIEFIEKTGKTYEQTFEDDDLLANYIRWGRFSTTACLWNKEAIREVGGWNLNQPVCQEHELILRLILAGKKFELLNEPLSVYRRANDRSISLRSPLRTLTHQMTLLNRLESFLIDSGRLQGKHRRELEQTRFRAARTSYAHDREFADGLIRQIYQANNAFLPHGDAAPLAYRVVFKMFGFRRTERISASIRAVRSLAHR
jgi:glycosyltransferase involved in cell wall biosynthesis